MPKGIHMNTSGVWSIMRPIQGQVFLAMVLAALATTASFAALCTLGWTIDQLVTHAQRWPWLPLALTLGLTILAYVLRLTSFRQSHYAAFRLEVRLRMDLAIHLTRLPLGCLHDIGSATLSKIMVDDVKALHIFVADSTPLYARAYFSPILTFILLCILEWRLALATAITLGISMSIVSLTTQANTHMTERYHTASENVNKAIVEYVQAMPVVRTFDAGSNSFHRYQNALQNFMDVTLQWYRMTGFSTRLAQIIISPLPILLCLGIWLINQNVITVTTWLTVLLVATGLTESLLPLMSLRHLVLRTQMSIHRIHSILALPTQSTATPSITRLPRNTSVRFSHVSFCYDTNHPPTLQDVSFTAKAGRITALLGPSGSGKTTIARLILRFWDANQGCIYVGDEDIRHMLPEQLMQHVAFVSQEIFLFADTIANNIRLGSVQATMEEVISAAKASQAHDFIMALPQGYETQMGERGLFLSGGQRQRITIARAILQNRPILILDEATAFADPENECNLIAALSNLMQNKTVLIIAHRLSTLQSADQILVFDQGKLLEQGRHDQLMSLRGLYARLWHQSERAQNWTLARRFS